MREFNVTGLYLPNLRYMAAISNKESPARNGGGRVSNQYLSFYYIKINMSYFLFPFDKVPKGSRIVLYGAGNVGKQFYDQATETNFCEIVLWLDKNADGMFVKKPERIADLSADDYDSVVIAIESETIANDVKRNLMNYGVPEHKILHSIRVSFKFRRQIYSKYSGFDDLRKKHILLLPYSLESSLNSGATILAFSYSRSVISSFTGILDDIEDKSLFFAYDYETPEEHERKLKEILMQVREKYCGKYNKLLMLGEKCREMILENNSYAKVASSLAQAFDVK